MQHGLHLVATDIYTIDYGGLNVESVRGLLPNPGAYTIISNAPVSAV